jgi:shikimate kinase
MRSELVLIGPVGVGKTTTSKELSSRLGIPRYSMDDVVFEHAREVGFDHAHWKHLAETLGRTGAYRYLRVFGAHIVKRFLETGRDCIFDFGGGGTMGEFPDEFALIEESLASFENVVLLLPSPDPHASLAYLYERLNVKPQGWTLMEHFLFHPSNQRLAKHVVYVKDKTPAEVADDVLRIAAVRAATG